MAARKAQRSRPRVRRYTEAAELLDAMTRDAEQRVSKQARDWLERWYDADEATLNDVGTEEIEQRRRRCRQLAEKRNLSSEVRAARETLQAAVEPLRAVAAIGRPWADSELTASAGEMLKQLERIDAYLQHVQNAVPGDREPLAMLLLMRMVSIDESTMHGVPRWADILTASKPEVEQSIDDVLLAGLAHPDWFLTLVRSDPNGARVSQGREVIGKRVRDFWRRSSASGERS